LLRRVNVADGVWIWGVKFEPISEFIFHPIFIPNEGDGGQTGGEIWVYIEFIAARLPTLQILGEKKVIPYLKFNTPVWSPVQLNVPNLSKIINIGLQ